VFNYLVIKRLLLRDEMTRDEKSPNRFKFKRIPVKILKNTMLFSVSHNNHLCI